MKRVWKIAGIATLVAILAVTVVGAVALADDDRTGWPFDFRDKLREAIAKNLNIDVETYDAAVEQAREDVLADAVAEGLLTEEQAERMQERMDQGFGPQGRDKGFRGPRGGLMGHAGKSLLDLIADELGMSAQDLFAELRDGKSIADVIGESDQDVDVDSIIDAYLAQLAERLAEAVDAEKITQAQADAMLERAEEMVPDLLNNTWEGRFPGGFRDGGRPGPMWGVPGQSDA
jgi:hypothetical protein